MRPQKRTREVGHPHPRGFTVAELLVCMGIVGMLTALILPAVQSGRDAARAVQCRNNLRQIGVAMHAFEGAHRTFPVGGEMVLDGTGGHPIRAHAPHIYLLPFLDQGALFSRIDIRLGADRTVTYFPPPGDTNEPVKQTSVPVYLCPSDSGGFAYRKNNYRANIGVTAYPRGVNVPRDPLPSGFGAFFPVRMALTPQSFLDGLSSTVGFSERLAGSGDVRRYVPYRDCFLVTAVADPWEISLSPSSESLYLNACASLTDSNPPHNSTAGGFWFYAGLLDTWYSHVLTPNSMIPDCVEDAGIFSTGIVTARSLHTGGVHCLMMDGATRFVSTSVAASIWKAVATRNGRESVVFD